MIEEIELKAINGEMEALEAYANLKIIEKQLKSAMANVEPLAQEEAAMYEKSFYYKGFSIEKRNGKANYSYKHLPKWNDLENAKKEYENQCKMAYKASQNKLQVANEDGELEIPIVSYSKELP